MKMRSSSVLFVFAAVGMLAMPASAQKTTIAAIMPLRGQFYTAYEGLRSELGPKYEFIVIDVNALKSVRSIADTCRASGVKALVLMDSKAISVAKEMQSLDTAFSIMPKFILMTLTVALASEGLNNVSGIMFEVPAYTLISNFRIVSKKDFSRVGVFYREQVRSAIDETRKLLQKEKISLDAVCVDCAMKEKMEPNDVEKFLSRSFEEMVMKEKIEVLWLMADNLIVNSGTIVGFWLKTVKAKNIPVIAPLETMASAKIGAAVFAADPDYSQLGIQAANLVTQFFEEHKSVQEIGFEPTISIKSTLNLSVASQIGWEINLEKTGRIDKIIK
jgi:ABC-type uncharacterized transport system substrate-binding protein